MPMVDKDNPDIVAVLSCVDRYLNQLTSAPLGDTATHQGFISQIKAELAKLTAEPEPTKEEAPAYMPPPAPVSKKKGSADPVF